MSTSASAVAELLADRPTLEPSLRRLVAHRADEPWDRAGLPVADEHVDELVDSRLLRRCDGGYRLADPDVVRAALRGDADSSSSSPSSSSQPTAETMTMTTASQSQSASSRMVASVAVARAALDATRQFLRRRRTVAVVIALAFVAVVRLVPYPQVYVGGDVVLSSNDPYYYRYLVERTVLAAAGPLDVGTLLRFPDGVQSGEPLLVATVAVAGELLGGHPWVTGTLLAWYPVVSALLTAVVVYHLATRLSDDPRVGLVAVGFFAVVPGHAFRTGLGFADHHAFDYVWLALTALAFVSLATNERAGARATPWRWSSRTTGFAALLGLGVAGQVLAWEAGPLLLLPLAVGLLLYAPFAVVHDRVASFAPIVAGLSVGAVLALGAHVSLGWQPLVVAAVPALLATGALGLAIAAALAARFDLPGAALLAFEVVGGALVALVVDGAVPALSSELDDGVAFLVRPSNIGEMQSLLDTWGPVFGPLILLGFTPFLAIPAMCWSLWDGLVRRTDYGWLLLSGYAWTFLGLSFVQRRFTGELAPFVSVFAALGFVVLVSKLELAHGPRFLRRRRQEGTRRAAEGRDELAIPSRRRVVMLGGFAAVFAGFPSVFSGSIHGRLTFDRRKHAAARWMRAYAAERGWEFPRSYVFSEWGENRMFNYFVSGESESYRYAQRNYERFLFSTAPGAWYEELRGRVGFIVTTGAVRESAFITPRMHDRLHAAFGSRRGSTPGLAHYRAVYAAPSLKVFTLVPGATIVGSTGGADAVALRTEVTVERATFTYDRRVDVEPGDDGFAVTVPYPGEYRVGDAVVTVTERDVVQGRDVAAE